MKATLDFTLRLTLCLLVLVLVAAREAPREAAEGSPAIPSGLSAELPVPPSVLPPSLGASDERPGNLPSAVGGTNAIPGASGSVAAATGVASWYPANGDIAAVPWWSFGDDPVWATVSHFRDGQTFSVTVLVQDHCQCLVGTSRERAIDLSDDAFRQLAPLSAGLIRVQIEVAQQGPALPPTDVR